MSSNKKNCSGANLTRLRGKRFPGRGWGETKKQSQRPRVLTARGWTAGTSECRGFWALPTCVGASAANLGLRGCVQVEGLRGRKAVLWTEQDKDRGPGRECVTAGGVAGERRGSAQTQRVFEKGPGLDPWDSLVGSRWGAVSPVCHR